MTQPKCREHSDCFANKRGRCVCLKDSDFGKKPCPFYQHEDEVDREEMESDIRAYAALHGNTEVG